MKVNILGCGVMGRQISALFLLGGFNVTVWNHRPVDKQLIHKQAKLITRIFHNTNVFKDQGQLSFLNDLTYLPDAVTIESVKEDLIIKRDIYNRVKNKITNPYFTNTSSYCPNEIGTEVYGMHFFNPISMKVIELSIGNHVLNEIDAILTYLRTLDFEIINVNNNRGYIGNYLLFREISSAFKLIEHFGYSYQSVLKMYKKMNGQEDIFERINLIGIDTVYQIMLNLRDDDVSFYIPITLKIAIDANILGKKNRTSIKQIL